MCVCIWGGGVVGGEGRWGKHKENQKVQNKAGMRGDIPIAFVTGEVEGGATKYFS